jgi:hypothetical protein
MSFASLSMTVVVAVTAANADDGDDDDSPLKDFEEAMTQQEENW